MPFRKKITRYFPSVVLLLLFAICLLHIDQRATQSESLLDKSCWKNEKLCTAQFCFLYQWTLHILSYTYSVYGNMYKPAWSRDKNNSKKKKEKKYSESLLQQLNYRMPQMDIYRNQSEHFQENKTVDLWDSLLLGHSCHVVQGTTAQVQWKWHQWTLKSHSTESEYDMKFRTIFLLPKYFITNAQYNFNL